MKFKKVLLVLQQVTSQKGRKTWTERRKNTTLTLKTDFAKRLPPSYQKMKDRSVKKKKRSLTLMGTLAHARTVLGVCPSAPLFRWAPHLF